MEQKYLEAVIITRRGRDYNKKRHWTQKHSDKPKEDCAKYVVPKNHELARKLLKSNKKESESQLQDNIQAEETGESSINQASLLDVIDMPETEPMQRSITNFMVTEENSETQSPVEKIQGDMNRVILMLESLTIPEKNKTHRGQLSVNEDITGVLSASNILEVKHPDIIVQIRRMKKMAAESLVILVKSINSHVEERMCKYDMT